MTQPANDHDRILISAEIIGQSAEPLIGEMTLTTDLGDVVVLVVNKEAAELLIQELTAFLDTQ
jgi:hypothetical protein